MDSSRILGATVEPGDKKLSLRSESFDVDAPSNPVGERMFCSLNASRAVVCINGSTEADAVLFKFGGSKLLSKFIFDFFLGY